MFGLYYHDCLMRLPLCLIKYINIVPDLQWFIRQIVIAVLVLEH